MEKAASFYKKEKQLKDKPAVEVLYIKTDDGSLDKVATDEDKRDFPHAWERFCSPHCFGEEKEAKKKK